MTQEEINKAAEERIPISAKVWDLIETRRSDFKAGVEFAQSKMYSEKDLKQFAFECVANFLSNDDNKVEMDLAGVIFDRINNKYEKFKK